MASAAALLRDAQHAFGNISPGSTSERKYTAQANSLARKIVRKYPASNEAKQARELLRNMGIVTKVSHPQRTVHTSHLPESSDTVPHQDHFRAPAEKGAETSLVARKAAVTKLFEQAMKGDSKEEDSWQNIWRTFAGLSYFQKKVFAFVALFLFAFLFNLPFLLFAFIVYLFRPRLVRRHLYGLLRALT